MLMITPNLTCLQLADLCAVAIRYISATVTQRLMLTADIMSLHQHECYLHCLNIGAELAADVAMKERGKV
jgi:hypothetical protein